MEVRQLQNAIISPVLQEIPLAIAPYSRCFLANLLEQGFEFALFQPPDQIGIIGLDSELIDRYGQFQIAIQIDHFSIFQNLVTGVDKFLASARAFHLLDIGQ